MTTHPKRRASLSNYKLSVRGVSDFVQTGCSDKCSLVITKPDPR